MAGAAATAPAAADCRLLRAKAPRCGCRARPAKCPAASPSTTAAQRSGLRRVTSTSCALMGTHARGKRCSVSRCTAAACWRADHAAGHCLAGSAQRALASAKGQQPLCIARLNVSQQRLPCWSSGVALCSPGSPVAELPLPPCVTATPPCPCAARPAASGNLQFACPSSQQQLLVWKTRPRR